MPETLNKSEINSKTDPSVSKQYDSTTPIDQQFKDLYSIIDGLKISMLTTMRKDIGSLPVGRSMAVSKRLGPDLLYLSNANSQKFQDLENTRDVQVTFQNTSTQDWVSIAGEATTISNSDPRIKELYTPMISAWFGDVGDGVHNGTADDPRMTLIEVKAKYIAYWKKEVTSLGFIKEVAQAAFQGDVAQTGSMRQLFEADIEKERQATPGMKGGNDNSTANVA